MNKHNRYVDISGLDEYGHAKANIVIRHNLTYADGRTVLVLEHVIYQKPIVSVFRSGLSTELLLEFESNDDADLCMAWRLLTEYSDPANSVNWTAEEVASGQYVDEDGNVQPVYYHSLEVILVPIGHEEEYQMAGYNPICYTLRPNDPKTLIPNVLQMIFNNEWFLVNEAEEPEQDALEPNESGAQE